jgi:hypothetical protein
MYTLTDDNKLIITTKLTLEDIESIYNMMKKHKEQDEKQEAIRKDEEQEAIRKEQNKEAIRKEQENKEAIRKEQDEEQEAISKEQTKEAIRAALRKPIPYNHLQDYIDSSDPRYGENKY